MYPYVPFIANTDKAWFDFLAGTDAGIIDEVNFWQPKATRPMKQMSPGDPIFFRLKKPHYAIAGYGFFGHFQVLSLDDAWAVFGWKNGDPDKLTFLQRIGGYREIDLLDPTQPRAPIGCTVLRDAHFWPPERWLRWGKSDGWHPNIVQGASEGDPVRAAKLLDAIRDDAQHIPADLAGKFELLDVDERQRLMAETFQREGQGTFRLRLLDAYAGRCAITGEHTGPVLDAAHIQPYLGPRSNHLQNGLVLTKEFHTLFDRGYVTITPDYEIRVSPRLRREWQNGHRYYPYDGRALAQLPTSPAERPSPAALEWHARRVFLH